MLALRIGQVAARVQRGGLKLTLHDQRHDLGALAKIGDGARLYAENTGATILAQGIEEPDDVLLARAMGATFGQGYYFGRPGPLPPERSVPRSVFPLLPVSARKASATPFEIISGKYPAAITQKRFLQPLSTYLESHSGDALLLISFQLGIVIGDQQLAQLRRLVDRAAFTVALGPQLNNLKWSGSRTGTVSPDDRFGDEWSVLVLSANYAGAVVARDLGDREVDRYRQFEFVVTHDRDLILEAAYEFLRRVQPAPLRDPAIHTSGLTALFS